MRLDKWLQTSRLIKRRQLASAACDEGRVFLNGRPAKPHAVVKPGDQLRLTLGNRLLDLAVVAVPIRAVEAKSASELYRLLDSPQSADQPPAGTRSRMSDRNEGET